MISVSGRNERIRGFARVLITDSYGNLEHETGLEPATPTLARRCVPRFH